MSKHTQGREPSHSGSVQLRAWRGPVVSTQVHALRPLADTATADSAAAEPLDEQWTQYLAAPTREARDRLVVRYTPLVRVVAHRVIVGLPAHVDHADLTQSGIFGLIEAIERFDPQRCPRFESFAVQRIRGAILDELRAQDWVPRTVRGRLRELERAQERLERRLQRAPTDREIAEEMHLPLREVQGLIRQVQVLSVEALDEIGSGVRDLFADRAPDPMAVVQAREMMRQLNAAVAGLGERDRTVIQLYYLEDRTLAEIGRMLGVTESRVCQLHARLVGRLRGRLDELARA
jgi:RNA polymerase sigma factor FliA